MSVVLFGDTGGPAPAGGFLAVLALVFIVLGILVGLLVFLVARYRGRRRIPTGDAEPPPTPPAWPPSP
jgi:hypothetical protein